MAQARGRRDYRQIEPFLFLGGYRAVRRPDWLAEDGITHVLNVRESCRFDLAERVKLLHRPLSDEGLSSLKEALEECCAFIEEARTNGGACLVHCHAGVNRSASIVLAYLMLRTGRNFREAFELVAKSAEGVHPHPEYFRQLQLMDQQHYGAISLDTAAALEILRALVR